MSATAILRSAIWQALDQDMLDSAAFNSERLLSLDPSDDNKHLMGLVLYRLRRYKAAANLTNGVYHVGCIYMYAHCCEKLKMITEGINALEQTRSLWMQRDGSEISANDTTRSVLPDAKIINILLGRLYDAREERRDAAKCFAASARSNPYLWESVAFLCKYGVPLQVHNLFRTDQIEEIHVEDSTLAMKPPQPVASHAFTAKLAVAATDPFSTPVASKPPRQRLSLRNPPPPTPTGPGNDDNPSKRMINTATPEVAPGSQRSNPSVPLAPQKRSSRNIGGLAASTANSIDKPLLPTLEFAAPTRRSLRTNSALRRGVESSTPAKPVRDRQPIGRRGAATLLSNNSNPLGDISCLTDLYRSLTSALYHFHGFHCIEALDILQALPTNQRDTPFVMAKIARLQFELVNYSGSKKAFERLRELDRTRVEDMEYFSTLLWHLRAESELSHLAHELIDIDQTSCQAWCALGNTFSLLKDSEQAFKCFKRAIQLDPESPYAYTLQAHEHITNDAYEAAREYFEKALRVDRYHYNAWYGLGMVYMRLGSTDEAETHFIRAAKINSTNVVLICCVGMIYEKKARHVEALEHYKRACEIQPGSALSRYRKARSLINLKLYNAALVEFDHLVKLAPDEARVHFLLGQLYKTMDNRELAVKHLTFASNLDPKGSHLIKEALEGLTA